MQFRKGTVHIRFLTWTLAVNIVARTGPQYGRWQPITVVQHFLHALRVLLVSSCTKFCQSAEARGVASHSDAHGRTDLVNVEVLISAIPSCHLSIRPARRGETDLGISRQEIDAHSAPPLA